MQKTRRSSTLLATICSCALSYITIASEEEIHHVRLSHTLDADCMCQTSSPLELSLVLLKKTNNFDFCLNISLPVTLYDDNSLRSLSHPAATNSAPIYHGCSAWKRFFMAVTAQLTELPRFVFGRDQNS